MSQSQFQNNSIFWVEVEKIVPNPYQPRREFDEERLKDLAESIRMYGVLQPLTVTRREVIKEDGGLMVEYELIAGERRHRASRLAGLAQVPVIIRSGPEDAKVKLELAIIENLQREDLNSIDRAKAFDQLAKEFGFTHLEIAKKVGKSREYVSNTIRLLLLSEEMQQAIVDGKMTEGHSRPLLMLNDRPEEQMTLFKEIVIKKLTVREAENIARSIAHDKVRKKVRTENPRLKDIEQKLAESFGTRVHIEERQNGGQLIIDFFSEEDLQGIVDLVNASLLRTKQPVSAMLERFLGSRQQQAEPEQIPIKESTFAVGVVMNEADETIGEPVPLPEPLTSPQEPEAPIAPEAPVFTEPEAPLEVPDFRAEPFENPFAAPSEPTTAPAETPKRDDDEMYSISSFTI